MANHFGENGYNDTLFTVTFMCLSFSVQNKIEKMDPENWSEFGGIIIVFLTTATVSIGYVFLS
jgi:hypothetical protein